MSTSGSVRAALAASLLARAGRQAVLVDDRWSRVCDSGLEVAVA